jgi:hypothetical protein
MYKEWYFNELTTTHSKNIKKKKGAGTLYFSTELGRQVDIFALGYQCVKHLE